MKKSTATVLASLAMALPLHAQEIEKLSWMTGPWTQNKEETLALARLSGHLLPGSRASAGVCYFPVSNRHSMPRALPSMVPSIRAFIAPSGSSQ